MTLNKEFSDSVLAETVPKSKQLSGHNLIGKTVMTVYGKGKVKECREDEGFVYTVDLEAADESRLATLYTRELPVRIKTPQDQAEELNVACETQEKMRRMNLEVQCFERGITEVHHDLCSTCLLNGEKPSEKNRFPRLQKFVDTARDSADKVASKTAGSDGKTFPRIRKLWGSSSGSSETQSDTTDNATNMSEHDSIGGGDSTCSSTKTQRTVLPRIQKLLKEREKSATEPCLICGNPVCATHSSKTFRKEGIPVCLDCERLFELDFIIECVSTPDAAARAKVIDHMIDCYDRSVLLLKYSTQFVDQIFHLLEQQRQQQNKIGLGSSSVGILSGVFGVAAAAAILTPAGPPLLIASLFFGGSATAVQTGSEAMNYFSEPNKLADRIIALHGMCLSILRVTSTLRDAMMRDHIRTDVFEAEKTTFGESVQGRLGKNKAGVLAASNFGRAATLGTAAGAEGGLVAGASGVVATETAAGAGARGATALSRAGTAAARTVRFARFAGGALSAAVLVMEANAMKTTLKEIRNGSPCEKANQIRAIADEVKNEDLPTTSELEEECQAYLSALANRPVVPPPEVSAVEVDGETIEDFPEAECAMVSMAASMDADPGEATSDLLLSEAEAPVATVTPTPTATPSSSSHNQGSFLGSNASSFLGNMPSFLPRRRQTQESSIPVVQDGGSESGPNFNLLL